MDTDYIHYIHCLRPLGLERAVQIHARIFSMGVELAVKEAMLELSVPRVFSLEELAKILIHLYRHELKVTEQQQDGQNRLELRINTCPFDYYLSKSYGLTKGCENFSYRVRMLYFWYTYPKCHLRCCLAVGHAQGRPSLKNTGYLRTKRLVSARHG